MKKKFWKLLVIGLVSLLVVSSVYAFTMGSIDATWGLIDTNGASNQRWATGPDASSTDYDDPDHITTTPSAHESTQNLIAFDWNQVRYGSSSFGSGSGFGFLGRPSVGEAPTQNVPFLVGQFCHFNNPVSANNPMEYVPLNINITDIGCEAPYELEGVDDLSFQYIFNLDETTNTPGTCTRNNYGSGNCLCRYGPLWSRTYRNRCAYGPGSDNWPSDGGTYCDGAGDPFPAGGIIGAPGDLNYNGCADMVEISTSTVVEDFDCVYEDQDAGKITLTYTVSLLGFIPKPTTGGCPATVDSASLNNNLVYTAEQTDNCYCVYAAVTSGQITPVTVQNLDAINVEEGILVSWETVTETNNLGFNIMRAESVDGAQTQINPELIMSEIAPGDAFGAYYEFLDENVEAGKTYYYWLIDVPLNSIDLPGVYGPVMVERH